MRAKVRGAEPVAGWGFAERRDLLQLVLASTRAKTTIMAMQTKGRFGVRVKGDGRGKKREISFPGGVS